MEIKIEITKKEITCLEVAADMLDNEGGDATEIRLLLVKIFHAIIEHPSFPIMKYYNGEK